MKTFAAVIVSLVAVSPLAQAASGKTGTVKLDPAASTIGWIGKKVMVDAKHHGTIKLKNGEIELKNGEIKSGTILIDMASIQDQDLTDPDYNKKLVGHLKSDDFFNVEKFPTAAFKITQVKALKNGANGATHEITGDLTLRDQTHPVTFPAKVSMEKGKARATGTISIDRTVWNIRYGSGKFFQGLGDKVIADQFQVDLDVVGSI